MTQTKVKPKPSIVEMADSRGDIYISSSFQKMIDYLHSRYPGEEWSGILVYTVESMDLSRLRDFKFTPHFFIPMDLGTSAFTDFEYDGEIISAYERAEELGIPQDEVKIGFIHSHHSMSAYFSATDIEELADNCKQAGIYLSLVVSTDRDYAAKIAFPSKVSMEKTYTIKDYEDNPFEFKTEANSSTVVAFDLDIVFSEEERNVPDWFSEKYNTLVEEAKRAKEAKSKSWSSNGTSGRSWNNSDKREWKKPTEGTEDLSIGNWYSLIVQAITGYHFVGFKAALSSSDSIKYPTLRMQDEKSELSHDDLETIVTKAYIKAFGGKPSDLVEYYKDTKRLVEALDEYPRQSTQVYKIFDLIEDYLVLQLETLEALIINEEEVSPF